MLIYFVTSNAGKVNNARAALSKFGITVKQHPMDLTESRSENPKEIAIEKAIQAYSILRKPVIVEDSGFFIKALGGFPMTHVKFSLNTLGIKNIVKMMRGVADRRAEWIMTVAYVYGKDKHKTFTFVEKGEIATNIGPIKRVMMSDFWRIYIPKMIKTNQLALSEMEESGLRKWQNYYKSHNQFRKFGNWFIKNKRK